MTDKQAPMFLASTDLERLSEMLTDARKHLRRARRVTTYFVREDLRAVDVDIHTAITLIERATRLVEHGKA